MPKGSPTTLFVSSTCYDLNQIRTDLREFANSLGYEPVLSEMDSFPVNPSIDNLENCLSAVRTRADIFVLVVGGRYGSTSSSGLSITNLEYLEASARGIPIFVFVRQEILTLLPTWKANTGADFSHVVDTPKLFEFVDGLRTTGRTWVFPFSTAQEIANTLRRQFSYLVGECLALRSRLYPIDASIQKLGPSSLRTFIEKPRGWEYMVLADVMREQVLSHDAKRMDLELGISYGALVHINDRAEAIDWILKKISEIGHIPVQIETLLNVGVERAVGPPGQPGDIERIIHLATRYADGYLAALEWTLEFRRVAVDEDLKTLMGLASDLSVNMIREVREFAETLRDKIEHTFATKQSGNVDISLKLTVCDQSKFSEELSRLAERQ